MHLTNEMNYTNFSNIRKDLISIPTLIMIVDIAWLSKSLQDCLEDDTEPRFVFFLDDKNSLKLSKLNLFFQEADNDRTRFKTIFFDKTHIHYCVVVVNFSLFLDFI